MGADGEELESVGARLELARDPGRDAKGVEGLEVDDVVVELDPARAGEHDVHLLGVLVPVPEALPHARLDAVVADAGLLGLEVGGGKARFLVVLVAEARGGVVGAGQSVVLVGGGPGASGGGWLAPASPKPPACGSADAFADGHWFH